MRSAVLVAHCGRHRASGRSRGDHGSRQGSGERNGGRPEGGGCVVTGAGVSGSGGKERVMIRAVFWKEWREHRLKYGAYWLVLNLPILITAICVALNKGARAPFADLSDGTAIKYLGLAMVAECYAMATAY